MGKRIISLQEAQSITNDDYLVIDNQSGGTKKVSAGFINDIVSDVEVDGTSVVNNGVAEIDLSGKQDTIVAGSNITIAADGKTISATDTTYTAGTNVQINNGVISATDTTYTAGTNVQIESGVISATDTTYTAGTNVDITGGVISATDTTYTAGTNVTIDANNVISASDTTYSAGTNVQINNGVISATDTTYSAFGGATAGADGSSGLVPQPLIADKDKFLKGDGTWDTIQPGASALDDLTNVDITSPTNGQVLKYDSTNQEWVNANESGGGGSSTLSGLSDVTITSPTDGQGLVYDATNQIWVNGDVGGGSGGGYSETTLFTGNYQTTSGEITLSDNLNNYDQIIIWTRWSTTSTNSEVPFVVNRQYFVDTFPYDSGSIVITSPHLLCSLYSSDYLRLKCGSANNKLFIFDSNNGAVTKVTGIKYGGGGSGDTFITYSKSVTTTQYGWWIVEDEDGNTLDPDTYVIIDISVNVCYYDVLWYQDSAGDYRATLFDINDGNTVRSSSTRTWTITYAKKDFSGGGGSSAMSDLTDVNLTSLSDGQILKYDSTSQKWINSDESGGGSSQTTYSTTEHQVGTWIDGSDLYERTINITAVSFAATQDMDISNYIDSTEVVHESIGVFNYTYQGANYATPINGRETEILYWDGAYKLRLNFGSGSLDSMDAYITIRYTKVTS